MLSFSFISLSLFSFAALQTSGTSLRVGDFNIKYDTNPSDSSAVPSAASLSASNAEPSLVNLLNPRNNKRHIQRSRIAKQKRASGDSEKGQKPWTDRRGPMAEQILFAELDIVGLQEVLDNQLQDLRALLGNNYQCVGVGREDGDTKGEAEPICFRTCKFEMQDVQYFWLSDTPDKPGSSTWDNTSIRMATMIKLLDKQTNENVYVVNTHLDDYGQESRQKGAELILERINNYADSDSLVIMTGDLNCLSTDKAYQILTGGSTSNSDQPTFLDTAEEVITSPDDNSKPSDDPSTLRGRFGEEFSNPAFPEDNLDPKTIDFILVLDNGYPVKDRQVTAFGIMPSTYGDSPMLSDHRLVVAHFDSAV